MNIAFLVSELDGSSTRYRVLKYIPFLKKKGASAEVFAIQKGFLNRQRLFRKVHHFDIVFLHRKLFRFIDWRSLRMNSGRLIYDFDDAVMFRDPNKKKHTSFIRENSFMRTVRNADAVIAGNDYLKSLAVKANSRTVVIPTSVDMERYTQRPADQSSDKVILGWIGSSSTLIYLEKIKNILDSVFDKFPHVMLKIVGDRFFDCSKMPVIKKMWRYEEEIDDLHSFDIGLMPLTDDPWSRGKCGFKLLQYMAVGIPAVCSPVGVNKSIVTNGVNGFLADHEEEWIEKLGMLIKDRHLRYQLGLKARDTVMEHYSTEMNSRKLLDLFDVLMNKNVV